MRILSKLVAMSLPWLLCATLYAQSESAANSYAPQGKTAKKSITLQEALTRLAKVRERIASDRLILEKGRSTMKAEQYAVTKLQLNQQDARAKELIQAYQARIKQLERERTIRESTGAKFYEAQSEYYQPMLTSDLDLSL